MVKIKKIKTTRRKNSENKSKTNKRVSENNKVILKIKSEIK